MTVPGCEFRVHGSEFRILSFSLYLRAFCLAVLLLNFSVVPAMEPVLMKAGQYEFSVSDFEYVYQRNRSSGEQKLDECLSLYIPYKLKIIAARDAGCDTLPAVVNEWVALCNQLAGKFRKMYRSEKDTGLLKNIFRTPRHTNKGYCALLSFAGQDIDPAGMEGQYKEFRNIAGEYLDGLLWFEISEREIWSKAASDTIGLANFYRKNTRLYRWGKRIDATIYFCADERIATQVSRTVENKNAGMGRLPGDLFTFFCDRNGVSPCVDTIRQTLPKGMKTVADQIKWKKGCSKILEWNGKFVFLDVHDVIRPARKTLEEARGEVVADYQNELDRKWIEQLKKTYPVTIDEAVWADLKKKYEE